MTAVLTDLAPGVKGLTLRNGRIEVTILPDKGADICALVDVRTGVDVMFKSPWGLRSPLSWSRAGSSMERWIEAYPGGWQLLLPNGGDECVESGVSWGYHGEAAMAPWTVTSMDGPSATLETRLVSVPLYVEREVVLDGPVLRIVEVVTNEGLADVEFMWSHHPAFGAPFLDASCILSAGCRSVVADDRSPGTLLAPGSHHRWPVATTRDGEAVDLTHVPGPSGRRAVLAYLADFDQGFFAITNPCLGLGVAVKWPLETFPHAWLWQEVHSGEGWPWFGRAYVVAVEPASTIPGQGFARAREVGERGVQLAAGESRRVVVEAVVFEGTEAPVGLDEGGSVRFAQRQQGR